MISKEKNALQFQKQFLEFASYWFGVAILIIVLFRVFLTEFPLVRLIAPMVASLLFILLGWLSGKVDKQNRILPSVFMMGIMAIIINAAIVNGGVRAPVVSSVVLFPLFGAAAMGNRGGWLGILLALLCFPIIFLLQYFDLLRPYNSHMEQVFFPLIYISGAGLSFIAILAFERARQWNERNILSMSEQLANTNRSAALGKMAGGMAHEINNPLAIISGRVAMLRRRIQEGTLSPEETSRQLENIELSVGRISKVISALRSFSGESENLESTPFSLFDFIEEVKIFSEGRFRRQGVPLEVRHPEDFSMFANKNAILQIVIHLLDNALDAVKASEQRWVILSIEKNDKEVLISIVDSGSGINSTIRHRILDPFFTTKEVGSASGLGLSVSDGLARSVGGELLIDDQHPNTKFTLRIPRGKDA